MAKKKLTEQKVRASPVKKRTSIGLSGMGGRPTNKSKRRSFKRYRGQG